jgi:hypothetical protein
VPLVLRVESPFLDELQGRGWRSIRSHATFVRFSPKHLSGGSPARSSKKRALHPPPHRRAAPSVADSTADRDVVERVRAAVGARDDVVSGERVVRAPGVPAVDAVRVSPNGELHQPTPTGVVASSGCLASPSTPLPLVLVRALGAAAGCVTEAVAAGAQVSKRTHGQGRVWTARLSRRKERTGFPCGPLG